MKSLSPISGAECPEHCGNPLFTLYSSLIIHRHSLSLLSLLYTSHTSFLFFSALFSPLAVSILLSHSCLLLSFATFLFQVFIPPFPALSLLSAVPSRTMEESPGWAAGRWGEAVRAGLWLTALCGAGCLAFVLLPRKMEGTQRGGARRRGRGPVRVSFMCRSFGNLEFLTVLCRGRGRFGQATEQHQPMLLH